MATLILGSAIATLDTTIATTALPTIAADLHARPETSIWIINAYQLAMVATLLPLAAYGDIVGHRRIYTGGLALFTLASLACGLASSLPMLIAARTLQGIGAAGILSVTSALIRFIYPHSQIGRAQGLNALIVAVFFAIGPMVASGVLAVTSWPWLFLINIPLGSFAVLSAFRALPHRTGERPSHSFDSTGGILVACMFGLLILGLGDAAHHASPIWIVCEWGASLVCFGALLYRQRAHPAPLFPVDLFRQPLFSLSVLTSIFAYATQGLAFVSLPFLFETVMGRSQTETGLLLTPWPVIVAFVAPIAGRLSERQSVAVLGGVGSLLLCLGMALLVFLPEQATFLDIAWRLAICGAGFGLFQSPNLKALTASVPRERAGAASGIIPTARLLGQALGTALVAACFTIAGEAGSVTALWLGSAFSGLACVTSLMRVYKKR